MLCFACDAKWPQFIRKNKIVIANKTCTGIVSSCKPLFDQMNVRNHPPICAWIVVNHTDETYEYKSHSAPLLPRSSTHSLLLSPTKSLPRSSHQVFLAGATTSSSTFSRLIGQTPAEAPSRILQTVKNFLATQS